MQVATGMKLIKQSNLDIGVKLFKRIAFIKELFSVMALLYLNLGVVYNCSKVKYKGMAWMIKSKVGSIIFVLVYIYLFYLVATDQSMLAMYVMAGGMLAESVICLIESFKS